MRVALNVIVNVLTIGMFGVCIGCGRASMTYPLEGHTACHDCHGARIELSCWGTKGKWPEWPLIIALKRIPPGSNAIRRYESRCVCGAQHWRYEGFRCLSRNHND